MDALTLLTQRKSNKKLTAPAPSQVQLEQMFQAALRAPDHGKLEPYHFVVMQGTGLSKLENLLKAAVTEFNLGEERLKKAENFARRAPMVIAVIAKINHEVAKVPGWEQMLTAGGNSAFSTPFILTRLLSHFGFYVQTPYNPLKRHHDHNPRETRKILNRLPLVLKAVYFYVNQWI